MKVLFIAHTYPLPPHSGGAIATLETLRSIQNLCELHLLVPPPSPGSERAAHEGLLSELLPDVVVHFYQPSEAQPARFEMYAAAAKSAISRQSYWASIWLNRDLRAAVERLTRQHRFDAVHCDWLQPAVSIRGLDLPLVIRTLDVHFVGMMEWVERLPPGDKLRKSFWHAQARRFRRFEAKLLASVPAVVTVSAEDESILRSEGVSNIVVIPPPREVEPEATSFESAEPCVALFIGRLDMTVNREAFFLFANKVWPFVSAEHRMRVRMIFAGGFPDEEVRYHASQCGIKIHAPLSDAESKRLFATADIFLSPVASGTGIKIKTLEAMAHGKPMIGFPEAFRGVPVERGVHALIADSPEEFARSLEVLIFDPARRSEIGAAAREFIRVNFDPAALGARLLSVYSQAAQTYAQRHLRQSA